MTPEYGYVRWRSKLTGKEDGINYPVANPAQTVARLNCQFPEREHWFIPAHVNLGPGPLTSTREPLSPLKESCNMYILTPDNSDGRSLSAIGPFTSLAAAMDWRSDAESQGVIHAGRYGLEALQEPRPLTVSTAMSDPAVTELLQYTDIGNGYHCWLTDDGPITVAREELRQAFEAAYGPVNPKWAMMVDLSYVRSQDSWRMP